MENQDRFKEALGTLLAKAGEEGNRLTESQIRDCFGEWELSEEQWKLIYSYLDLNKVIVAGHNGDRESLSYLKGGEAPGREKAPLTGEDSRCYQMYLEEIRELGKVRREELEVLALKAAEGDREARNRLAEGYLGRVVELAREYAGRGVLLADLVQEGNMALLTAMDTFASGDFGVHITREICTAMDAAIAEQTGQDDTGSYLAAQANAMMKATEELVEELGREATLAEVAARMNLSEDMARDIMKISMDALSLVDANGGGEVFGHPGGEGHDCGHSH